jgi:hypothetical protein
LRTYAKTGFLRNSGHTNHVQALISKKMIAGENQLIANDLGCQNIFGQNKGWQR